jgi:hypothetical protein
MPTSRRYQIKSAQALEILGRAIRRAPHREAFIPDVKSWEGLSNWRRQRRSFKEV